jgi:glutathione-independent formaldehyde dehydrogenase
MSSNSNRGVVYLKPGSVEIRKIDFPSFRNPAGKTIDHGVILKVVTTNICGSDQHMVRGRTTAPAGMVLGHGFTGEMIEGQSRVVSRESATSFRAIQRRARAVAALSRGRHRRLPPRQFRNRAGGAMDMSIWADGLADRPAT